MEVVIWGSRGSVPCSSRQKIHFGTNTPCVEVDIPGGERVVFDAGTGLVSLGNHLEKLGFPGCEKIHLFFSHFHWDHVQGLPFFKVVYRKQTTLKLYGQPGIERVFSDQMTAPFSPVPFEALPARIEVTTLEGPVTVGGATVTPVPLNHPQGCYAYIVEHGDRKFVYATDTEPDGGEADARLEEAVRGAGLLVMDSNHLLEEVDARRGWGHSSWKNCAELALRAGVKRLVLFHHDPFHDDEMVTRKERLAQEIFPESVCAYEGMRVKVARS